MTSHKDLNKGKPTKCLGLNDRTAQIIRKAIKYTEHFLPEHRKSIFIGGIKDQIDEMSQVEKMCEEFGIQEAPKDVTHLLNQFGFEDVHVLEDDLYEFGEEFVTDRKFDIVINLNGVGGRVFDQKVFFENVHNICRPSGLIIHSGVWFNPTDNCFYSYNPYFWLNLAGHNYYKINALFLVKGNDVVRMDGARFEGTGYELVRQFDLLADTRPSWIYTIFTNAQEPVGFKANV